MYNVNGMVATLIQYNRNEDESVYDDQDKRELDIVVCPYNVDQAIRFGIYTVPEATGSFIIRRHVDIKEGDQIVINDKTFTILKWADKWLYNRIEYKVAWVK